MRVRLARLLVGVLAIEAIWVNTVLAGLYLQAVGDDHMEHRRPVEALRAYRLTVYLLPYTQHPRENVAGCLARLGREQDAIAILGNLVEKEPWNVAYRRRLASLLLEVGREDEAVEQCRAGLYRLPEDGHLCATLARALLAKGQASDAVSAFQQEGVSLRYDVFARELARALRESGRASDAAVVEQIPGILRRGAGAFPPVPGMQQGQSQEER